MKYCKTYSCVSVSHRDMIWENAVGKMVPINLLHAGLPQTFNLYKIHLQSVIKQGVLVLLSERSQSEKGYILYYSNYKTFWKRQEYEDSKKFSSC